ncbi:hypothetical protein Fcan01_02382 [Folsomia candida]|uniref:Uncharacterized protein n=1 Tax=Folsomia candida TaxID=158441 RepID=A0A226EW44_FOLCA|nr:hypothetical protein Fcan01_02382 [Folsomia candida]
MFSYIFNYLTCYFRSTFVFGEMFNSMEDMFKEMEQSMKDIDSFFQDLGNLDGFIGSHQEDLPSLPMPLQKSDENVRNWVLKEPEKVPILDKSEKIDKDLDDLFTNSVLPLTDLPEAPKDIVPSPPTARSSQTPRWGDIQSSFERVYSTHSFKNGRWEGKIIKENNNGKEITSYSRNGDTGEQVETTEFIPNTSAPPESTFNENRLIHPGDKEQQQAFNPFQIFERLFKPRL